MAQGESNRVGLYFFQETVWNEAPASPIMIELPYTGETLGHAKQTATSNIVRADRMRDDVAEVAVRAEGDINIELKFSDYQPFLEAALGSAFASFTYTGSGGLGDLEFTGNDIVGPASTWDALVVGQYVKISGAAQSGNNGIRKVTAKTSTNLTVDGAAFTAENNSTATVKGKVLRNGVTKKSFLIEKRFSDVNQFIHFRGMRISQMSLAVESQAILTGTFSFMGARGYVQGTSIGNASSTAASSDAVMNGTSNVGTIEEGGATLTTALRALRLTLNNNLRELPEIGNKEPAGVNYGSIDLTGTIEAYFEDAALYTKLLNHTASSLHFRVQDSAGNVLLFTIPKVFYSEGNPNSPGINQDVMLPINWTAVRDPNTDCEFQVDALSAA